MYLSLPQPCTRSEDMLFSLGVSSPLNSYQALPSQYLSPLPSRRSLVIIQADPQMFRCLGLASALVIDLTDVHAATLLTPKETPSSSSPRIFLPGALILPSHAFFHAYCWLRLMRSGLQAPISLATIYRRKSSVPTVGSIPLVPAYVGGAPRPPVHLAVFQRRDSSVPTRETLLLVQIGAGGATSVSLLLVAFHHRESSPPTRETLLLVPSCA